MKRKVKSVTFVEPETTPITAFNSCFCKWLLPPGVETEYDKPVAARIVRESDWKRILKLARGK